MLSQTLRRIVGLAVIAMAVVPAQASALTATGARAAAHPGFVRAGASNCLKLTSVSPDGHGFRVKGVERQLFEGSFMLPVRDATGRVAGRRVMTARGAWTARVAYRVSNVGTGTLEAVADSAKDGSLACLVQVRVGLNP